MGVEIKLTDKELPVSPAFMEFLHRYINRETLKSTWHDQLNEELIPADAEARHEVAKAAAEGVLQHPVGQKAIYRSYELLTALLVGAPEKLRQLHAKFRFVCVVGCPRHGGSYLTKQLFVALGMQPDSVPNVIAHDGFPNATPFLFKDGHNAHTHMTHNMAEYLAMVELYFGSSPARGDRIVVPKKATKAAYHGAFFNAALGSDTEYVITLRHPLPACISTYEKSTGLPADGKFKVRGNIEGWAQRDNLFTGEDPSAILNRDYFDVYLRYWEQYHYGLATSGLGSNRNRTLVVYGAQRMMGAARDFMSRFGAPNEVEEFKVFDNRKRHADWKRKADHAVARVSAVWRAVGLAFPVEEVMECW